MRLTETELSKLVRSQAARRLTAPRECLSERLLLRAAAKELGRHEREQVASHLAVCSDCVRDYRIARSVRSWAEEAAISNGLQAPLAASHQSPTKIPVRGHALTRDWRRAFDYHRVFHYAVAASLITFAVLGGWFAFLHRGDVRNLEQLKGQLAERDRAIHDLQQTVGEARGLRGAEGPAQPGAKGPDAPHSDAGDEAQIAELRKMVSELSKPQFNVPIVDVEPSRARGEADTVVTTVEVPKSANLFTLILHTSGRASDAGYSLEILSAGGKLIFRGNGLRNTPDNGLTVALSRHIMPAGKYNVRLYDLRRSRSEPIEQYVVEVHYR